jgi:hypothetical protein
MVKLSPPPRRDDPRFDGWVLDLFNAIRQSSAGSRIPTQFISQSEAVDLTDGGDSTLHYHASDRKRSNHTGTQLAATISDLDTVISNAVSIGVASSGSADIIATQVFGP